MEASNKPQKNSINPNSMFVDPCKHIPNLMQERKSNKNTPNSVAVFVCVCARVFVCWWRARDMSSVFCFPVCVCRVSKCCLSFFLVVHLEFMVI